MIMPSDKDYKSTKLIKQGIKSIDKRFIPLADWIFNTYNVKPLNILFDKINKNIPRLQVCFEYLHEKEEFEINFVEKNP